MQTHEHGTAARNIVLAHIAKGVGWNQVDKTSYRIGSVRVHVRYKSRSPKTPGSYSFDINRKTLTHDYEVWICGDESAYYLIPIGVIRAMHAAPAAYQAYRYPGTTVVSVDTLAHSAMYAADSQSRTLEPYFKATLPR